MEKIKFWVNSFLKLLIILLAGFTIYSWNLHNTNLTNGIPLEIQLQIDSLVKYNYQLTIDNERMKERNSNLYVQISQLENQLAQILPSTEKRIIEYRNSPPERKKEIINSKVMNIQNEMKGEQD